MNPKIPTGKCVFCGSETDEAWFVGGIAHLACYKNGESTNQLISKSVDTFDVMKAAAEQLGSAMAANTDSILREAITRFLGRDDWALADLKERGALIRLQSGIEVFSIDGVALVEFRPIENDDEQDGFSHALRATRQHRFLVYDRADKNHLEA